MNTPPPPSHLDPRLATHGLRVEDNILRGDARGCTISEFDEGVRITFEDGSTLDLARVEIDLNTMDVSGYGAVGIDLG